jgi:hypothetical protein
VLTGPFSPLFGTFFRAKRVSPTRLGPLRAGLGQKIEPACLHGPARFSNRAWRAGPKTGRASPGSGWAGRPVWPSLNAPRPRTPSNIPRGRREEGRRPRATVCTSPSAMEPPCARRHSCAGVCLAEVYSAASEEGRRPRATVCAPPSALEPPSARYHPLRRRPQQRQRLSTTRSRPRRPPPLSNVAHRPRLAVLHTSSRPWLEVFNDVRPFLVLMYLARVSNMVAINPTNTTSKLALFLQTSRGNNRVT